MFNMLKFFNAVYDKALLKIWRPGPLPKLPLHFFGGLAQTKLTQYNNANIPFRATQCQSVDRSSYILVPNFQCFLITTFAKNCDRLCSWITLDLLPFPFQWLLYIINENVEVLNYQVTRTIGGVFSARCLHN